MNAELQNDGKRRSVSLHLRIMVIAMISCTIASRTFAQIDSIYGEALKKAPQSLRDLYIYHCDQDRYSQLFKQMQTPVKVNLPTDHLANRKSSYFTTYSINRIEDYFRGLTAKTTGLRVISGQYYLTCFVEFTGMTTSLYNYGYAIDVGHATNGITTITLPLNRFEELCGEAVVTRIFPDSKIKPALDYSLAYAVASQSQLHPTDSGLQGDSIIIGIIDVGVDVHHPDFRIGNSTRLLYYYDRTDDSAGLPPTGFGVGAEWNSNQINAVIQGTSSIPLGVDENGHGTAVASVATGNGAASSNPSYVGVAPDANIIAVKLKTFADVAYALSYLALKSKSIGRPWVANLSVAQNMPYGAMDGYSAIERFIDDHIVGPANVSENNEGKGRVVVTAMGNERASQGSPDDSANWIHASGAPGATKTLVVNANPSTTVDDSVHLYIVYSNASIDALAYLTSPDGSVYGPVALGSSILYNDPNVATSDGEIIIDHNDFQGGPDVANHDPLSAGGHSYHNVVHIVLRDQFTLTGPKTQLRSGLWYINVVGTFFDRIDAVIYHTDTSKSFLKHFAPWDYDSTHFVPAPAGAEKVITVGSIITRESWQSQNGLQTDPDTTSLHRISPFSNLGPVLGPDSSFKVKPELYAPGQKIVCARASQVLDSMRLGYTNLNLVGSDTDYIALSGTSLSAPHVTGAAALLLQCDTNLTWNQVKHFLIASAPWNPEPIDPSRYDLNVLAAIQLKLSSGDSSMKPSAQLTLYPNYPNPFNIETTIRFAVSESEKIGTGKPRVSVTIYNILGRHICTLVDREYLPGEYKITWDGKDDEGNIVASGIYFCKLQSSQHVTSRKMILLK